MSAINNPDDARLLYRMSCKGPASYELPRTDSDDWIEANINPPSRSPNPENPKDVGQPTGYHRALAISSTCRC
jgi:hypothetical protein